MIKCFYCGEEIIGHRNIGYLTVSGEKVPFHESFVRDCKNGYRLEQRAAEHQADDTYSTRHHRRHG